jgi:hypothetical protein
MKIPAPQRAELIVISREAADETPASQGMIRDITVTTTARWENIELG